MINSWNSQNKISKDSINDIPQAQEDLTVANRVLNLLHFYAVTITELDIETKNLLNNIYMKTDDGYPKMKILREQIMQ